MTGTGLLAYNQLPTQLAYLAVMFLAVDGPAGAALFAAHYPALGGGYYAICAGGLLGGGDVGFASVEASGFGGS